MILRRLSAAAAELDIYDHIGFGGVEPGHVSKALKDLQVERLTVNINSVGGDVWDGMAIYNLLERWPGHITAHIDGIAASIASVLMQAADEVIAPDNATIMIHDPHALAYGFASDLRKVADNLDRARGQILDIYTRRAGDERRKEVSEAMTAETWLTGSEALELGLVDETTAERPRMAACADLSRYQYRNAPQRLQRGPTARDYAETAAQCAEIAARAACGLPNRGAVR